MSLHDVSIERPVTTRQIRQPQQGVGLTGLTCYVRGAETGRILGFGLIVPELRYAAVIVPGVSRVLRCAVSAHEWAAVSDEIAAGLALGDLPATSAIARILAAEYGPKRPSHLPLVQLLPVEYDLPAGVDAASLDAQLAALAA